MQKLLSLQQPEFEQVARGIVQQPAMQIMQQVAPVLQNQVPADKRDAAAKTIEADIRKYVDETYPLVRERALKLAPSTVGTVLEEKFSEDELKQLIAWYESPVNRKFQQAAQEIRGSFLQKLAPEARSVMEPKLQALEPRIRAALGAPPAAAPDEGKANGKAAAPKAATPPARPASK
ncbi:MAG TPA: DUF2059 domain-containing protein [Rubrivivax sp.]|nr:DUF2059 domain-containing protein [Rubrivivax sp.]